MQTETRKLPFQPTTLDPETGRVRVTWTTGAPVLRRDAKGPFLEILSLDDGAVDLSRLIGGPVLDTHRQQSLGDVLGRVADAGIDSGAGWAVVEISARHKDLIDDIGRGIVRQISVGYQILAAVEGRDNGERTLTATRWQPFELSFVPIGADPGASTRVLKGDPMNAPHEAPALENRAQVNQEIRSIVAIAGLSRSVADELIDAGADADAARKRAFDELAKRQAPAVSSIQVGESFDNPRTRAQWIGEAAFANAGTGREISAPARQYANVRGPLDVARACLEAVGERTAMLSPASLIERAMSTSDFPLAMSASANLALRASYDAATPAIMQVVEERTAPDFKDQDVFIVSGADTLVRKNEGGEITYGSVEEHGEKMRVVTFARAEAWTREALINDSRGAFLDRPAQLGRAARETEALELIALLTAGSGLGPVMSDGKRLFHADHGNLASAGTIVDTGNLGAARLAMRKQVDLKGRRIGVEPRFVLVPPDAEMVAEAALANIQPTTTAAYNPFAHLRLLVEARLENPTRWYVIGSGVSGAVIVRLEGRAGPQLDSMVDFNTKNINYSVLSDFGVGFVDHRGWYSNPGA